MRLKVLDHYEIGRDLRYLALEAPDLPRGYQPGQFVHIKVSDSFDHLLRRPLSLCRLDVAAGKLVVVYRITGAGTRMLSEKIPGQTVDVLGPLGHGFPLHDGDRHAILIGGGIGVPPMVELALWLKRRGARVTSVIGFQSSDQVILTDELREYGDVLVATDDGTCGHHGLLTERIDDAMIASADRFYACGPTPMLRAVQRLFAERLPGYLSLEERMGCGIGVCLACVHGIRTDDDVSNKKVCKDGPVFCASEVVFS